MNDSVGPFVCRQKNLDRCEPDLKADLAHLIDALRRRCCDAAYFGRHTAIIERRQRHLRPRDYLAPLTILLTTHRHPEFLAQSCRAPSQNTRTLPTGCYGCSNRTPATGHTFSRHIAPRPRGEKITGPWVPLLSKLSSTIVSSVAQPRRLKYVLPSVSAAMTGRP